MFFWVLYMVHFIQAVTSSHRLNCISRKKAKAKKDRKEFNNYMEEFYNASGAEEPTFVRHLFYFPRIKNKLGKG